MRAQTHNLCLLTNNPRLALDQASFGGDRRVDRRLPDRILQAGM